MVRMGTPQQQQQLHGYGMMDGQGWAPQMAQAWTPTTEHAIDTDAYSTPVMAVRPE